MRKASIVTAMSLAASLVVAPVASADEHPVPTSETVAIPSKDGIASEDMAWIGVGAFFSLVAVAGLVGSLLGTATRYIRPYLA